MNSLYQVLLAVVVHKINDVTFDDIEGALQQQLVFKVEAVPVAWVINYKNGNACTRMQSTPIKMVLWHRDHSKM